MVSMHKQKLILLYNWHCQEKHWIPEELRKRQYEIKIIDVRETQELNRGGRLFRGKNLLRSFQLAKEAIEFTSNKDIIISMTSTPGICCALLLLLPQYRNKKVGVLALNTLAHWGSDHALMECIRDKFYATAFQYRHLWTTVNIANDISLYQNKMNIPQDKIIWLPDAIENLNQAESKTIDDGYIFSGGMSERDWRAVVYCASNMPNEEFVIVANKKYWLEDNPQLDNLKVYFDIPQKKFNELLNGSKLVLLTVRKNGVAGLMVLFQALRSGKIFIATDTEALRIFVAPGVSEEVLYPSGKNKVLLSKLEHILKLNKNETEAKIQILSKYIYENYSEEKYLDRLEKIIKTMKETTNEYSNDC